MNDGFTCVFFVVTFFVVVAFIGEIFSKDKKEYIKELPLPAMSDAKIRCRWLWLYLLSVVDPICGFVVGVFIAWLAAGSVKHCLCEANRGKNKTALLSSIVFLLCWYGAGQFSYYLYDHIGVEVFHYQKRVIQTESNEGDVPFLPPKKHRKSK